MITAKLKYFIKNILAAFMIAALLSLFASCVTKTSFLASSVVPLAQGYAKVSRDNDQNYVIQIHISDLAEVERLQNFNRSYVAWMETNGGVNENLGELKSSSYFLSNQLKASLKTTSPHKPIKIFITAENRIYVQQPGKEIILSTDRF